MFALLYACRKYVRGVFFPSLKYFLPLEVTNCANREKESKTTANYVLGPTFYNFDVNIYIIKFQRGRFA